MSHARSCDCLACRFGNAADQPDRVRRYPSDMQMRGGRPSGRCCRCRGWVRGRGGQPEAYNRAILTAIRYRVNNGIKWRAMPACRGRRSRPVASQHDETRYRRARTGVTTSRRDQGHPSDRALGTRRARAAALLMLTLPGGACVYQVRNSACTRSKTCPKKWSAQRTRLITIWSRTRPKIRSWASSTPSGGRTGPGVCAGRGGCGWSWPSTWNPRSPRGSSRPEGL